MTRVLVTSLVIAVVVLALAMWTAWADTRLEDDDE